MSIKIGLMDSTVTNLKSGPKVFMSRLKASLKEKGYYSNENFDTWINLSFKEIPEKVLQQRENTKIILRFDGIYNMRLVPDNLLAPKFFKKTLNDFFMEHNNEILKKNYKLADKVIFQSEYSKKLIENFLLENNLSEKESIIIKNGVNLEYFKPSKETYGEDCIDILVSHRMVPTKRVHQIPSISKVLDEKGIKHRIHLVGTGVKNPWDGFRNTLEKIKKEIKKTKTEKNFIFHGHINPEELPSYYNKCDLMLNLSYADPCPNVVIEAMACGLPVVAPKSGGIKELVYSDVLLVNEDINPNPYWTTWSYNSLPKINPVMYAEKVIDIYKEIELHREETLKLVHKKYDINVIVAEYVDFLTN